ncbi:MAG: hypothetical protein QOF15_1961, partial [Mycobacterium sp.]|nr:hypothetical protein [Mycobacterium sp.]
TVQPAVKKCGRATAVIRGAQE